GNVPATSALEFSLRGGGKLQIDLDPPCSLANEHGTLRVQLAKDRIKAGTSAFAFTVRSGAGVKLAATPEALAPYTLSPGKDWVAFTPTGTMKGNVVGLGDWLDK